MKTALLSFTFALSVWIAATPCYASPSAKLADFTDDLGKKFPDVATITTGELAAFRPQPVLLDVRTAKEFAVSRLPGATHGGTDPVNRIETAGNNPGDLIVVYCSVGYRSAVVAGELEAAGFSNIRNLEGSIFAWANEGRALENDSGPTDKVHPFNFWWGRYLDSARHASRPEE